jgi:hypothetical protein
MRKSTFALALSFLVAIAWFGLHGSQPRAAEPAQAVQKWEYHNVISTRARGKEDLDKLGSDGWEMCGVLPSKDGGGDIYFKRPKSESVEPKDSPKAGQKHPFLEEVQQKK